MKSPFKSFLGWWQRLGMREQVAAAVVGSLGLIGAAVIGGWFTLSVARVQTASVLPTPNRNNLTQSGSGNFQAGKLIVHGNLNILSLDVGKKNTASTESDNFIPLKDSLKRHVESKLKAVKQLYGGAQLNIVIAVQDGDSERMKFADQLIEIFKSAGFNADAHSAHLFSQDRTPMRFDVHPVSRAFAIALGEALEPTVRAKVALGGSESRPSNELYIDVYGKPRFLPDGVAVFN